MNRLTDILERLEKATTHSRDIDVDIFRWLHPEYAGYVEGRGGLIHPNDGEDVRVLSDIRWPAYTASLDSAIALVERCLPGWSWECRRSGTGDQGQATVWNPSKAPGSNDQQRAYNCPSPPIALLIALFRALSTQEDGRG